MCTGPEIAAIASMVGGTALQNSSQRAKVDAYNRNAEATSRLQEQQAQAAWDAQRRQHDLESQRRDAFHAVLPLAERGSREDALADATASRADLMREVTARPEDGDGHYAAATDARGAGPRVVRDHADRRRGEADDFVRLMGDARARLGAWGEGQMPLNTAMTDAGFDIGELARQSRSDTQLSDAAQRLRLQRAQDLQDQATAAYQNTGNKRALAGNLLTQAGTMGMGMAGNRAAAGQGGKLFQNDYGMSDLGRYFRGGTGGSY